MRCLLVVAVLVSTASADEQEREEPKPVAIHGKLDGATAILTVRYVFPIHSQQTSTSLALPSKAAVSNATVIVDGTRHRLDLRDATQAGELFDAATTHEPAAQARSTILVEGGDGNLQVSTALPHAGPVTLELEMQLPTCFFRDARYTMVPTTWLMALDPSLRALSSKPADIDNGCNSGNPIDDLWIGFPSRELASKRETTDRLGAFGGRVVLGQRHIARVELDVAGMLADVPRDLATVIVVDGSRSMTNDALEVQRKLVASYLSKAPESRVQVIAYARRAAALLPGWTTAAQAGPSVDQALRKLVPLNGSNVDAGLADAASWLSRVTGTRRIVLFSDGQLAKRLAASPASLSQLVPPGTLIHVVEPSELYDTVLRDDTFVLAPLAAATEGMAVRAGVPEEGVDMTLLVRPITVDRIRLKTPGWKELRLGQESSCDDALGAGRTCTWWGEGSVVSGPIAIEAYVWGRRLVRFVRPDAGRATAVARELSFTSRLDDKLLEQAQLAAHAVNRKWSLYAEWGGSGGYSEMLGTLHGCCRGGHMFGTGDEGGFGTSNRTQRTPHFDLHGQLAPVVARCLSHHATVEADVENTLHEIVAVSVAVHAIDPMTIAEESELHDCVEEAIWGAIISVPPELPHETTHVAFN